jgi:hypothetical protein
VVLGTVAAATSSASAAAGFYEPFNYTVGSTLASQPLWDEPLDANDNNVLDTIQSGSLTFGSLSTSGNSVRTFGKYSVDDYVGGSDVDPNSYVGGDGNTIWFSFLLRQEVVGSGGAAGADYGGLVLGRDGAAPDNQVFIGKPGGVTGAGQYVLEALDGVPQSSSGVNAVFGQTAFLVASITFHTAATAVDNISLYVNPTPGGVLSSPQATLNLELSDPVGGFNDWYFSAGANAQWTFDELRIGASFADVSPIPEPAGGLLALSAGALALARRRRGM